MQITLRIGEPLAGPWTENALKGAGLRDFAGKRTLAPVAELA
jgi:hypothetical protein